MLAPDNESVGLLDPNYLALPTDRGHLQEHTKLVNMIDEYQKRKHTERESR